MGPNCSPEISVLFLPLSRKGSSKMAKRSGEKRQPCVVLFEILKGSDKIQLILTWAVGEEKWPYSKLTYSYLDQYV